MNRMNVYKEIDELHDLYCDGCLLKTHFKKNNGKRYAHRFCIQECTVGLQIQQKGKALLGRLKKK